MLCVWRAELTEVNTRWNSGGETKMSSQGLGHRSTETAEKSRMAGKRLAKLEKKALPRVETTEKSRMAGKRLAKFEKKALPRVELGTFALRVRRSTAKLQRQ